MKDRQGAKLNTGIVALVLIFLVAPLIGTHSAWALIPLAVIGGIVALAWRYLPPPQRDAGTLQTADVQDLERRIAALEAQVRQVIRDHDNLEEVVRWQERLQQSSAPPVSAVPPVSAPASDHAALKV